MEVNEVLPPSRIGQLLAESFGQKVRSLRLSAKWSQAEVAKRMGDYGHPVHQTAIGKMEAGTRPTSVEELLLLSRIFNVDPSELVPRIPPSADQRAIEDATLAAVGYETRLSDIRHQIQELEAEERRLVRDLTDARKALKAAQDRVARRGGDDG